MESLRKPGGLEKFQVTDREECGVIVRREEPDDIPITYVLKVPNRASEPNDYEIWLHDVQRVEAVLSEHERVIGFMHTHLKNHKCEPSDRDFEGAALFPNMENLIYHPATKKFVWYGPEVLIET